MNTAFTGQGIATNAEAYNATIVGRTIDTPSLQRLLISVDGEPIQFLAGQYVTCGLEIDERIVQRPYSIASAPDAAAQDGYEVYIRRIDGGAFTSAVWSLPIGHRLRVTGPRGRLTLDPADRRSLLLVASGTGIAPFVAMLRHLATREPRRTVLLHGVSYVTDLGYDDFFEQLTKSGELPLFYLPSVSRPRAPENASWSGRTGRVETHVRQVIEEFELSPANCAAYLCGIAEMIKEAEAGLIEHGFPPDAVSKEFSVPRRVAAAGMQR